MIRGFFDLPDWITTVQRSGPRFTGVHVFESERSRGQCWRCRRMIGKRGESYVYVMHYLYETEELHACPKCHRKAPSALSIKNSCCIARRNQVSN